MAFQYNKWHEQSIQNPGLPSLKRRPLSRAASANPLQLLTLCVHNMHCICVYIYIVYLYIYCAYIDIVIHYIHIANKMQNLRPKSRILQKVHGHDLPKTFCRENSAEFLC
jgi:hypothetical protein